ncbi:hypothetical protein ALMP_61470 [Streptomyces sp. A012304]|nr:hypothetical protein ALMP_61470 [Streptomyces sp. A012304]
MWKVRREREPLLPTRIVQGCEAGTVLIVAPGELHVVQHDPPVGGIQFGQRGQPREQVRLMDRAHPATSTKWLSC